MTASTEFKIKRGIPVRRPRAVYPFEAMEIGDCFDAPDDMGVVEGYLTKSARRHSICASARNFALRCSSGFKVTTAVLREDGQNIVRVWRVA